MGGVVTTRTLPVRMPPPQRLLHYLRKHRKSAGLSQHELAKLLGCSSGAKVSRYEHFQRLPSLMSAIAYEIIFKASLRSLLPGLYAQVRAQVGQRARALADRVKRRSPKERQSTSAFLKALADGADDAP